MFRGDGNVRYNYFSLSDPFTSGAELPEGVRHRKCVETGSGIEDIEPDIEPKVDPIRWFGFMPPDSLKKSQVSIYLFIYGLGHIYKQNSLNEMTTSGWSKV